MAQQDQPTDPAVGSVGGNMSKPNSATISRKAFSIQDKVLPPILIFYNLVWYFVLFSCRSFESNNSTLSFFLLLKLWSIYAAGNTVPIPFLKAIDISPLALVSDNVVGDKLPGSSSNAALEAVRELFSGDGQTKKGRKGQTEVPTDFPFFLKKKSQIKENSSCISSFIDCSIVCCLTHL